MFRPGGAAHPSLRSLGGAEEEEEGRRVECMRVSDWDEEDHQAVVSFKLNLHTPQFMQI